MFDIGWTEMLVLGIVILLVMGPRELPSMLRTIGHYVGRVRHMAQNFRDQLNDIQTELDAREQFRQLTVKAAEHDVGLPDLPDLFNDLTDLPDTKTPDTRMRDAHGEKQS